DTYDHRTLNPRLPVRSAIFKQRTGGLVVRWVTTSEYPLLYVLFLSFASFLLLSKSVNRRKSRYAPKYRARCTTQKFPAKAPLFQEPTSWCASTTPSANRSSREAPQYQH
ncbi:hypothetical protein BU26DRAFT_424701, partial [Trematosphaeria pertusa]